MAEHDDLTAVAQAMADEELTMIVRNQDDDRDPTDIERAALKELGLRGVDLHGPAS